MKDVLGREVEIGNLVVVKGTGRNNAGLRMGVFTGTSVKFKDSKGSAYNECFLISNPTDGELKIKDSIYTPSEIIRLKEKFAKRKDKVVEPTFNYLNLEKDVVYENKTKRYIYFGDQASISIIRKDESRYNYSRFAEVKDGKIVKLGGKLPKLTKISEVQYSESEVREMLKPFIERIKELNKTATYGCDNYIPLIFKGLI